MLGSMGIGALPIASVAFSALSLAFLATRNRLTQESAPYTVFGVKDAHEAA